MRNFEADRLVRIGDVLDILEKYDSHDYGYHEIDLGELGTHPVECLGTDQFPDIVNELLEAAERLEAW